MHVSDKNAFQNVFYLYVDILASFELFHIVGSFLTFLYLKSSFISTSFFLDLKSCVSFYVCMCVFPCFSAQVQIQILIALSNSIIHTDRYRDQTILQQYENALFSGTSHIVKLSFSNPLQCDHGLSLSHSWMKYVCKQL